MRYALIRFKGQPTKERPVGMGDIVGIADYMNQTNAKRYLWDNLFTPPRPGQLSGTDYLKVLGQYGYTHFGLYEVPTDFAKDDKLVKVFENPWGFLAPEEKTQ